MYRFDAIAPELSRGAGMVFAWRGDMAADDPRLDEGRMCERCGQGHLEVVGLGLRIGVDPQVEELTPMVTAVDATGESAELVALTSPVGQP